jgi:multisubunit Na+/H+ antiporter MnhB subunit
MVGATSNFLRFINAVHRRYVVWRLLERTGLGLLGGSIVGLGLLPLVLWADKSPLPFVSAMLSFGSGLGVLWGALRRPTRLDSAMQADQQLGLKDLLGTALSLQTADPEPWGAAVLAVANARCEQLKQRAVLLNRISARAWGGIGLSAAGALTLALFFGAATDSRAAATRSEASAPTTNPAASPSDDADRPLIAMASAAPAAAPEHDDPDGRSMGQSTPSRPDERNQPPSAQGADSLPRASNSAAPGTGSGFSQTKKQTTAATPPHSADNPREPSPEHVGADVAIKNSATSGGSAQPDGRQTPGAVNPGGVVTNAPHAARLTPPWKTDAWPADVQRAHAALDAGQVPPAYQEMVRRYFER